MSLASTDGDPISGAPELPAGFPRPGSVFADKYRLVEVLGQGGMGIVLGGEHVQLQQPVAIKLLLPSIAAISGTRDRFVREARAAARIQGEHAVRILDVGESAGIAYMIMERLSGVDLEALSVHRGPLPVDETAGYVLQACAAVAEAHAAGIVHRDLKPANLFLAERPDGTSILKVLDFGISKTMAEGTSSLTAPNAPIGSPPYMSPEQVTDARSVDARTDVWSLGVILFELLTREQPFLGSSVPHLFTQILLAEPRRPRDLRPDLPVEMEELILACLARDPAKRIPDAAELGRRLEPFAPPSGARSIHPPISSAPRLFGSPRTELAATLSQAEAPAMGVTGHRGLWSGRGRGTLAVGGLATAALLGLLILLGGSTRGVSPASAPELSTPSRSLAAPSGAAAAGEASVAPSSAPASPDDSVGQTPGPRSSGKPLVLPVDSAVSSAHVAASTLPPNRVRSAPPPAPSVQPAPKLAATSSARVRDLTAIKPIE